MKLNGGHKVSSSIFAEFALMKKNFNAYINQHGGTPRLALHSLVRSAIDSDFARKVAETFATRVLLIVIGIITSVIIARVLGPQGRGLYAMAAAIGAIGVQFGNFGLHASNIYSVAKDHKLLPALIGNTLFVSFVIGGLGAAIVWLCFTLFPQIAPLHDVLLILALVWIPFGLANMLLQNLLLGLMNVRAFNKIDVLNNSLSLGLIGILAITKMATVESIFVAGLISLIISFGLIVWQLRIHNDNSINPSLSLFKKNIGYGMKVYLTDFAGFLVFRLDLFMVNYYRGATDTGLYSIAVSMADLVYMVPIVIGTILFPKLSGMELGQWQYTKKIAFLVALFMLPLVLSALMLARPAVQILYGKEFIPAIQSFNWLMPGIYMISIQTIFVKYLAVNDYPVKILYIWLTALVLNISLNIYLIPSIGIVGASIASSIAYTVVTMLIIRSALSLKNRKIELLEC